MEELSGLLLPLLFLVVLWFLLIRPQQKRRKEQQQMVQQLSVGDDVVTIGGLHGRVVGVNEDTMDLAVDADEEFVVRYERSALARIVADETDADETPEIE